MKLGELQAKAAVHKGEDLVASGSVLPNEKRKLVKGCTVKAAFMVLDICSWLCAGRTDMPTIAAGVALTKRG